MNNKTTLWDKVIKFEDEKQNVIKFVFEKDDAVAEAVLYKYPTYKERTVICCSVMSGCPVGCVFCGTGKKFVKNLKYFEIVDQIEYCLAHVKEIENTNAYDINKLQIMFMSMGEPFLNYDEVSYALNELNDNYPNAQLLLSTMAPDTLVPCMQHEQPYSEKNVLWPSFLKKAEHINKIGLQFSIHKSTDYDRNKIIPFEHKCSLETIMVLGYEFNKLTGRKPFFNYCVDGTNNTDEDANRLLKLFNPSIWEATISVICESDKSKLGLYNNEEQEKKCTEFANKLVQLGFNVRVFNPAGKDTIGGGCGQLHYTQDWFKTHEK